MTHGRTQTLGVQALACQVQAQLAALHPDLPGAYFLQSLHYPNQVNVQLGDLAALEAWRTALIVSPDVVKLGALGDALHLEFRAKVGGADVRVWATGQDTRRTPRPVAGDQHQLDQPHIDEPADMESAHADPATLRSGLDTDHLYADARNHRSSR